MLFSPKNILMPALRLTRTSESGGYLLWRISEPEKVLIENSTADILDQPAYKRLTHPQKRREWLAARLAIKQLLTELGYEHNELQKEVWGRPYLASGHIYLSIAHCSSFAAAALARESPIGIDIQLPCKKLQGIKGKFLSEEEVEESNDDIEKLCIYWCAKEAIYKTLRERNLYFKRDIRIQGFTKKNRDTVWGKVRDRSFAVHYSFYGRHVLAWSSAARPL